MASITSNKPIIIFVPGAWHIPWHYSAVMGLLIAAGYDAKSLELPSVGTGPPVQSFDADVAAVRALVLLEIEKGRDVIVVAHSYGGAPTSEALKGTGTKDREAKGRRGAVVGIVFMAAFVLRVGESVVDPNNEPAHFNRNGQPSFLLPDVAGKFYFDCDPEVARTFAAACKPFSFAASTSPISYAAWQDIPSWYIYPVLDKGLSTKAVEEDIGKYMKEIFKINAAHSPFASAPDAVVSIIRKVAGETIDLKPYLVS
ncbi:alpha/beta-hydrolase [Rhizodiscina lignyota]|uniref:Alpha/beta-hydrolase n=1 Tax=Rhizodiscina lignyota TaxID=1504668 RepID=A0A9P4M9Z5_9PEZI|nr:alpha/beta-hydrolase [Rhizodiscina lignyota]